MMPSDARPCRRHATQSAGHKNRGTPTAFPCSFPVRYAKYPPKRYKRQLAIMQSAMNPAIRNLYFFAFVNIISPHFLIFYPYACWYIPRIDETYAIYASLPKSRLTIWKIPHPYDRTPAICPHVAHNPCFLGIFLQICTDDCRFRFFIQWNQRHGLKIFRDNLFIVFSSFVVIIGNTHQIVLRQKSCIVCFLQGTK